MENIHSKCCVSPSLRFQVVFCFLGLITSLFLRLKNVSQMLQKHSFNFIHSVITND